MHIQDTVVQVTSVLCTYIQTCDHGDDDIGSARPRKPSGHRFWKEDAMVEKRVCRLVLETWKIKKFARGARHSHDLCPDPEHSGHRHVTWAVC
jgi:hypothetical protein